MEIPIILKINPKIDLKQFPKARLLQVLGVLILGLFAFSFITSHITCVGGFPVLKKTKKTPEKTLEQIPIPVKVYKAGRVSFRDSLPSLGTIKGFREFDLKFPTNGNIEYINFREGEKITQGDIIASLDQKEALLKLEYAKLEADKQARLYELGSVLEVKLKQAQLEYQSAKAELDKTNLVAVSDGYIGAVEVDKGSYVTPQDRFGSFVDFKDVYVEFGIIEKDVGKVREGQNAELTVDSFPDQIFKGKVDSISPIVEGRSRTVKARAKISNPDEKLKPGMFGRVNLLVYEKEDALVIPSSSFKKKDDQYLVYIVHPEEAPAVQVPSAEPKKKTKKKKGAPSVEDTQNLVTEAKQSLGTIETRNIEVNYATPDAIEVKDGIDEGDLIIVDVEQDLQDKAKVEITETQEGIF